MYKEHHSSLACAHTIYNETDGHLERCSNSTHCTHNVQCKFVPAMAQDPPPRAHTHTQSGKGCSQH